MLKYCCLTSPILPLTRTQLSLTLFYSSLPLSLTLIMDPRKRKQPDSDLNEDPISQADDNWRERSALLRIRNKAVIARVLYKRTDANAEKIKKSTMERVTRALLHAKCYEEMFYTKATDEHDYRMAVSIYINSIPNTLDTIQAAMKVTSDVPKDQLIPRESSWEIKWFNVWILLETLSVSDISTRAQNWPNFELFLASIGCHTKTFHAVLLAFIGSHANTIYTAQQQLQPQQQQQYQPSSFLYLDALVQSIRSIKSHLQERPPLSGFQFEGRIIFPSLQQQEGPNAFQKELHDVVMAFVDQIQ